MLVGAVEARCALPPVHPPLLSMEEWWTVFAAAVLLGAAWGLLAASFVALSARGRGAPVHGLVVGLSLAVPVLLRVFLSVRPHFGPGGRLPTLAAASAAFFVVLALPVFLSQRLRRQLLLPLGIAMALGATVSGTLLAPIAPVTGDSGANRPPSLLLITVDTTRNDHLPPYARYLPDNGFFWSLQRNAVRFSQLTAPIPLTGPSHSSLLTGLLPEKHGAQDNGWPIRPGVETLATALKEKGYATSAVLSGAVLYRQLCGLDRGFDEYDDSFRPATPLRRLAFVAATSRIISGIEREGTGLSHQRRARETAAIGLRFLQRHPHAPFFLWLHFYDPHRPYDPAGKIPAIGSLRAVQGEPTPREDPGYWKERSRYAGEIGDVDRALKWLDDRLEESGWAKNTVVVTVTDHGESFGTHGHDYRFDHGGYLYDDELHLAAWWKETSVAAGEELPPGTPRSTPSVEIDTLATQALGMDGLGRAIFQRFGLTVKKRWSSTPSSSSRDAFSFPPAGSPSSLPYSLSHSSVAADTLWFCLRRPTRKLIVGRAPSSALVYEAYDLAHDPNEMQNLLPGGQSPESLHGIIHGPASLRAWQEDEKILLNYANRIVRSLDHPRPELSPAARARLRSLGYLR